MARVSTLLKYSCRRFKDLEHNNVCRVTMVSFEGTWIFEVAVDNNTNSSEWAASDFGVCDVNTAPHSWIQTTCTSNSLEGFSKWTKNNQSKISPHMARMWALFAATAKPWTIVLQRHATSVGPQTALYVKPLKYFSLSLIGAHCWEMILIEEAGWEVRLCPVLDTEQWERFRTVRSQQLEN